MGIEPTSEAWEASILPLYDARLTFQLIDYTPLSDSRSSGLISLFSKIGQNAFFWKILTFFRSGAIS
jgi:hypothetical protein